MAEQPSPPPAQALIVAPQSTGIVGAITSGLDALKTSPVLLLIVLLNGFFIATAGYYLLQVEHYRADDRKALAALLDRCVSHSVPLDYLIQQRQKE